MFKNSVIDKQMDMFSETSSHLQESSQKKFDNPNSWHNLFRTQVYSRVDENHYKVLFDQKMGAPNAPIRLLISMMILKEAFGWSDQQLFEQCNFNLLVRSALGLINLSDKVPVESTYYLLRKRIYQHRESTGEDLLENTFEDITSGQIKDFEVNGKSIRMDSKLLGSNIGFYTRYEIVHRTLCLFYNSLKPKSLSALSSDEGKQLKEICSENAQKTVYHSIRKDIEDRLKVLGILTYKVLLVYKVHASKKQYQLLDRVFNEHFKVEQDQQIILRPKEELTTHSVQSPHDPDSAYRQKGDQKVKGYSVNVTETNSEDQLNLITNIQVDKANAPDTEFVKPSIESTQEVSGQQVEKVYADGAYQSPANEQACQDIDMVFTGMQGAESRYELQMTPEGLLVTDTRTLESEIAQKATKTKRSKEDRYYIVKDNKRIYFGQSAIRASQQRQTLKQRPIEELRKRNNVEATIYQLVVHVRNNKTRYRTMIKQKMWALCRSLWINFIRILNHTTQTCQRTIILQKMSKKSAIFHLKTLFFAKIDQLYLFKIYSLNMYKIRLRHSKI